MTQTQTPPILQNTTTKNPRSLFAGFYCIQKKNRAHDLTALPKMFLIFSLVCLRFKKQMGLAIYFTPGEDRTHDPTALFKNAAPFFVDVSTVALHQLNHTYNLHGVWVCVHSS